MVRDLMPIVIAAVPLRGSLPPALADEPLSGDAVIEDEPRGQKRLRPRRTDRRLQVVVLLIRASALTLIKMMAAIQTMRPPRQTFR
jgi:hypothetical protein